MLKSLLFVAAIGDASCGTPPPAPPPREPTTAGSAALCRDAGDRLALRVCRRDQDLAWTVTNRTGATLWVFVAPPAMTSAAARDNAFVEVDAGAVVLHKLQLPGNMDEPVMTGAIALAPGASDTGVVPLGRELVGEARNLWPLSAQRRWPARQPIESVVLEVGFAERLPSDRPIRPASGHEFYFFMALDRSRQRIVRSPGLPWR